MKGDVNVKNQFDEWMELLTVQFPDQEKEHLACFALLCCHLELAGAFDKGVIIIHDVDTDADEEKPRIEFPFGGFIDAFVRPDKTIGYLTYAMPWDWDAVPPHISHTFDLSTLLSLLEEYGYTEENEDES